MSRAVRFVMGASALLALSITGCGSSGGDTGDAGGGGGDGGGTDACVTDIAVICDGTDVVARDLCSGSTTPVESCSGECFRGECVECLPEAGRVCDGGDVHYVDSCGAVGELVEPCSGECRAGACVGDDCVEADSTRCVEDTVYEVDSCGNLGNAVQVCDSACTDGACEGCTPGALITCYDGDIYSLDSCERLEGVEEECPDSCEASSDSVECVSGVTCTPEASIVCFEGDMHYMDSCNNIQEEIEEDCPSGCDGSGCLPCTPVPVGDVCSGGDVHELLGGCPDMAPGVGDLVESCDHGCADGACLPEGCTPDAGTVCVDGDVHTVDSCGSVGDLLESCASGCDRGACTGSTDDAGMPTDAGGTDAGTDAGDPSGDVCECVPSEYPAVDCTLSADGTEVGTCNGCFGFDDFCTDEARCTDACASEFSCTDGVLASGEVTLGSCAACAECESYSCEGCFNSSLCETFCSPVD